MNERGAIFAEAASLIAGDRAKDYGDAVETHQAVAAMFNAAKGQSVLTGGDVVLLMRLLKIRRSVTTPTHRDSYVDECGYAAIGYDVAIAEAAL
jgi:hypothetical protein